MEAWIAAILSYVTSPLRDLVDAVKERIAWVYGLITRVLASVKAASGRLFNSVADLRNWLVWAIGEGFLTMRWLITIRIPGVVASARDAVIRWATDTINRATTALGRALGILDQWAKAQIAGLFKGLVQLKEWTLKELNGALDILGRVRDVVFNLLTSPSRLASWLVGAMVNELWRYANANADRIARWLRGKSIAYTLSAASQIESIIARLL